MTRFLILISCMLLLQMRCAWTFQPPFRHVTFRVQEKSHVSMSVNGENSGIVLKPRAQMTDSKATQAPSRLRKVLLRAQACVLYSLFILYRGYRGFFVIIPAVFREVYLKLESTVDPSPFEVTDGVNWQTRITVALMATVLTASYIVGGFVRVMMKLGKTIFQTSDIAHSFEEAAKEQEVNEDRVTRLAQKLRREDENLKPKSDTDVDKME